MSVTLRSFSNFILYNRLRAIGLTFALTFVPLVGTMSIIITGLVTLRKGALEGFWILIAATLPYFLLLPFQSLPLGLWIVGIITASNLLTWIFAILLNRYNNWNLILELTALIGIIIVTTVHIVKPDIESWWEKQLTFYSAQMLSGNNTDLMKTPNQLAIQAEKNNPEQAVSPDESLEPELISFVNAIKPYATGALAASLLFTALLQLLVSRWWQLSLNDPRHLSRELHRVHLTSMAGIVFLATLILSYVKITLAQDMLPVLYLTFCIAGLSLVHFAASKFKGLAWLLLLVFYIILFGSWMVYKLPLLFQLLALAALLDVWFDWRGRLDKRFSS